MTHRVEGAVDGVGAIANRLHQTVDRIHLGVGALQRAQPTTDRADVVAEAIAEGPGRRVHKRTVVKLDVLAGVELKEITGRRLPRGELARGQFPRPQPLDANPANAGQLGDERVEQHAVVDEVGERPGIGRAGNLSFDPVEFHRDVADLVPSLRRQVRGPDRRVAPDDDQVAGGQRQRRRA